jgi:thioredoxin 1
VSADVVTLTSETFDAAVKSSPTPFLVDFWADWCAPCLALAPVLEELAGEEAGRLRIGRVNTMEEPGLAAALDVETLPTLLLFQGGAVVKRIFGARGKRQLLAGLEPFLS